MDPYGGGTRPIVVGLCWGEWGRVVGVEGMEEKARNVREMEIGLSFQVVSKSWKLEKGWWKFYRGDGNGGSGSEMGGCDDIGDGSGGSASGIGGSGGIGDGSGGRGGGKNNKVGGRGRRGGGMASRGGGRGSGGGRSRRGDRMIGSSRSGAKTITSIGLLTTEDEVPDRSSSTIAIFATLKTSDTTKVSEDAQIDKGNASASVDKGKAPTTVKNKPAPKRKRGRPPSHDLNLLSVMGQKGRQVHVVFAAELTCLINFLVQTAHSSLRYGLQKTSYVMGTRSPNPIDWGIPELARDVDGDEKSPKYKTNNEAEIGITYFPFPESDL
nr:hypothetical protein [Tanacetum cinerariifolium]